MRRFLPLGGFAAFVIASGCGAAPDSESAPPEPSPETGTSRSAIASVMGGADTAIDAPWRLEPIGDDVAAQVSVYPPIPIVVSIHDASLQRDPEKRIPFGDFCGVTVKESWKDGQYHYDPLVPQDLPDQEWVLRTIIPANSPAVREIERSDRWPYSSDHAANHRVCRQWAGESCASNLNPASSAEWHATIAYVPQQMAIGGTSAHLVNELRNGDDVYLTVTASFARAGTTCAANDRVGFTDTLAVHLGNQGLPRFGENWVYGDLHYHSQGTDNEGESAYAYRPTLQAMRAMGLDFAFATEHASDSGQVTDMDPIFVDNPPDTIIPDFIEDWVVDKVNDKLSGFEVLPSVEAARDMNQERWNALRDWLNRAGNGANAEALRAFAGGRRVPRLFLGGEVDVVPEMSAYERQIGSIYYGNRRQYRWGDACTAIPDMLRTVGHYTTFDACPYGPANSLTDVASEGDRYLLKDLQGLLERFYARQHIVYLPHDGSRDDAFVASRTTVYGGAHERLKDLLRPDYWNTMSGKGYAFLAHPVDAASGNGFGRLGPDIVPYSEVQLRTAFASQTILGLQLWNEDSRLETSSEHSGFPWTSPSTMAGRSWGHWRGKAPKDAYRDLHDGLVAWDRMLQWGLLPSQTSAIPWLPAGEPRRVLMAGGSDAHGDWNYRREGRLTGVSAHVDTALGKPRNLLNVGATRAEMVAVGDGTSVGALGQSQVTSALARGEFAVTDGPALRIAIDVNGNGIIDDADVPMGGVFALTSFATDTVPVIVEWKSTPEFQTVESIDLYVGVANTTNDVSAVYAPIGHGIHSSDTASGELDSHVFVDASGVGHRALQDHYLADPTGLLHFTPAANYSLGRKKILLRPSEFPAGNARVVTTEGEPVCVENFYCHKPGFQDLCAETCTTPTTTSYAFESASAPGRMFVRAFARTRTLGPETCNGTSASALDAQRKGKCIERLAFTNPVWVMPKRRIVTPIGGVVAGGVLAPTP